MRPVSHRRALFVVAFAAFVALCLGACDKPGDACTDSPGSCKDKKGHLVCVNKAYVLETCLGKDGCNDEGKSVVCDNTIAGVGDGCGHEGARACSADGTKELRCRSAKFEVEWSCKGGCTLDANNSNTPKCAPTGEVGDACPPNLIVCDGAAKTELNCQNGKLAVSRTCHGALGCQTMPGGGVRCDKSQALEGEACREEGTGSCDTTKKNVLVCNMGHYKTQLQCLGPLGCELPGNYSVRCDKSIVPLNEPCTEDLAISCSTEGKQVQCKDGKFGLDPKWKPKKDETCSNRYRVSLEIEKFEAK
jgi:hypothetical protein